MSLSQIYDLAPGLSGEQHGSDPAWGLPRTHRETSITSCSQSAHSLLSLCWGAEAGHPRRHLQKSQNGTSTGHPSEDTGTQRACSHVLEDNSLYEVGSVVPG